MDQSKLDDVEAGHEDMNGDVVFKNLDFTEKTIRQGFIRKVYGILMVQLSITLAFVSVFMFVIPVKQFVYEQAPTLMPASMLVMLITLIVMMCSTNARRKAPGNYIFLAIFTVSLSFIVGVVSSVSDKEQVFMAIGITTVLTLALTLFAMQTKYDFTVCHTSFFLLLTLLVVLGITGWFIPQSHLVKMLIAGFGAFVFCLLIVYDTQLIIGGEHKYSISPEEYVFAALTLYLDIINLFFKILRLLR